MRNVATSIFYLKPFARIYEERADTLFLSAFSSPPSTLYPHIHLLAIFLDSLGPSSLFPRQHLPYQSTILILLDPVRSPFLFILPLLRQDIYLIELYGSISMSRNADSVQDSLAIFKIRRESGFNASKNLRRIEFRSMFKSMRN